MNVTNEMWKKKQNKTKQNTILVSSFLSDKMQSLH